MGEASLRCLDLLSPQGTPTPAAPRTELTCGERVFAGVRGLRFRAARDVRLKTPNEMDFVLMKLDAMRIRRPRNRKDAFDLHADVRKKAPAVVNKAVAAAPERDDGLQGLHEVFADENAGGVLAESLEGMDRKLVAGDVLPTFAELRRLGWAAAGRSLR